MLRRESNYRDAYGLYACNGILFNHESPMRPVRFVTRKIISTACKIANGSKEKLNLGNLEIKRDWGWAPEYVDVMWRMLQQNNPEDYVIATGETNSLEDFCKTAFNELDLDWSKHVTIDKSLIRPSEIMVNRGCSEKAKKKLGWQAKTKMHNVICNLIKAEMKNN